MRALCRFTFVLAAIVSIAGSVGADTPDSFEQPPQIAIKQIRLSSGDTIHQIGAGGSSGNLNFPVAGGEAEVTLDVTLAVSQVEDLRLWASFGGERQLLERRETDGQTWQYRKTWRLRVDDPRSLRLYVDYRPRVLPLPGRSISTEDGKIDLQLSGHIAADENLRAGSGCRGAVHSYFGGDRIIEFFVDVAQLTGVLVVDVSLDILATYLGAKWAKEGASLTWRYVVTEIGKRFVVGAGNSLTQSIVNSFIKGTPWLRHWQQNSFNAFVAGVFGGAFGKRLSDFHHGWLRRLGDSDDAALKAFAQLLGRETSRGGTYLSTTLLGGLWSALSESYRSEADRHGLTPRFFVALADDTTLFSGYRVQVAGLQWLTTGQGALLVSCTPPGGAAPTANYLITFKYTGGGVSDLKVASQPVASAGVPPSLDQPSEEELKDLAEKLQIEGLAEAARTAEAHQPTGDGWRAALASGPMSFVLRNYVDASEVPSGAAWRIDRQGLDLAAADGSFETTEGHGDEVLVGQGLRVRHKVQAAVGSAWLPVLNAAVGYAWNGLGAPATGLTDEDGLVAVELTAPAEPAYLRLEATVGPDTAARSVTIVQAYDYGLEDPSTAPESGRAEADGAAVLELKGRVVRLLVGANGRRYSASLAEPRLDFDALRFVGSDHRLVLELNGDEAEEDGSVASFVPERDGRFTLAVRSEVAGSFTIRLLPLGGRFRTRDLSFAELPVVFTGGPSDFRLTFGQEHQAGLRRDGVLVIDDMDLRTSEEVPLTILAKSTLRSRFDEPVEGVRVRLSADKPEALSIRYSDLDTDPDGVALGGSDHDAKPSLWGLREAGPIVVTIGAEGAQEALKVIVSGVETREDFALAATADPDRVDTEVDPWTTISGSLRIPPGEDMGDILTSRYKLWVSVRHGTLEVEPEYLLGEISWGGINDLERLANLKPQPAAAAAGVPQPAEFSFRVGLHETTEPQVKVYVLDTREQETVQEVRVAIEKVRERIATIDGRRSFESCEAIGLMIAVRGGFPAEGWVALVPAGADDLQHPADLEPEQKLLGPLTDSGELFAPEEPGAYELRLYRDSAGDIAHSIEIAVEAGEVPEEWRYSDEPGVDRCNPPLLGYWELKRHLLNGKPWPWAHSWLWVQRAEREGFVYLVELRPVILPRNSAVVKLFCNRERRWLTCLSHFEDAGDCPATDYIPSQYRIAPDGSWLSLETEARFNFDEEHCSIVDLTKLFEDGGNSVPVISTLWAASDATALDCTPPMDPFAGETFDPDVESFEKFLQRVYAKVHCTPRSAN